MTYPPDPQQPYGAGPQQPYGAPPPNLPPPPSSYGDQPSYGQPQYGQPAPGDPQYGQPQFNQPPYGQPAYGQPPYGQPPHGQPPYGQPPKKSSGGKIALFVIGGVVALCLVFGIIGAVAYNMRDTDSGSSSDSPSYSAPLGGSDAPTPGSTQQGSDGALNKPVRDGDAEFVVKSVKCGVTSVGQYTQYKPKGQFCLVDATVKNLGSSPLGLTVASANEAFTKSGEKYDLDITGSVAANEDTSKFLSDVAPGSSTEVTWAWDIPAGQTITKLTLYESFGSDGVSVTVS
ncbi:DUF4352 domain-containing protein [Cryptosporangium aurantiacum]|uniref:DUF4352 domain-containing protein n=1 Tax=Cryptosporangium aurantiacum TaxID=134849 RepID=A0A1M7RLT9_9ACTN|nr:DUF4352 domain-containing protein [Cryptosporangium aurantiacum]SHN47287.1 protein of unknown function [Cryptosporangium aurantiacum]